MVTMDEYIEQLLAEMTDRRTVVQNILDKPIPEAVKDQGGHYPPTFRRRGDRGDIIWE